MTHALVRVYATVRDHLDAYAVAEHLVPDLMGTPAGSPNWRPRPSPSADLPRGEMAGGPPPLRPCRPPRGGHRKHRQLRCRDVHGPGRPGQRGQPGPRLRRGARHRGRPPVVVRPRGGGRLRGGGGGGVRTRGDSDSVVAACLALAKDGTRSAIEAVCEVAARHTDFESALVPLREAVAPYDTVGPDYRSPPSAPAALPASTPSRNSPRPGHVGGRGRRLPARGPRLGQLRPRLRLHRHHVRRPRRALGSEVPHDWAKTVAESSRLDLNAPARTLTEVTGEIFERDARRHRAHASAYAALTGTPCSD